MTNASDVSQSASDVMGQKAETIFVTSTFGQKLSLPPNVGFEIGKVKTLLYLQVHFKPMKIKTEQEIGVDIHYTENELPLKAGIYSLHAAGMFFQKVIIMNSNYNYEFKLYYNYEFFKL